MRQDKQIIQKHNPCKINMEQVYKTKIEDIIGKIKCSKDFKCYQLGFENLCRAKDIGIQSFLECLEEKPNKCNFSIRINSFYLCSCPLRIYIAKNKSKVKK